MFYYSELLRAKRALYIAGVLIGLFLLTVVIVRLSVGNDVRNWSDQIQSSPGAHVTRTTLSDGSVRSIVDDPSNQTHAVILQHPDGSIDMNVTEPAERANDRPHMSMGDMDINERTAGRTTHVTMHYRGGRPIYNLGYLFLASLPIGLIISTMLGGVLAKENDGHLELAWTKPATREAYALCSFAVDTAAIWIAQVAAMAAGLLANFLFFAPRFSYSGNTGWFIALTFVAPAAWYALLTVASASLKRGPGIVIGLGWVAAVLIPGIAAALAPFTLNAVANAFHAIFAVLTYLDPIAYVQFHVNDSGLTTAASLSAPLSVAALCGLCIVYLALAVAQWRRVEA